MNEKTRNELEILLKDYEVMRTELRLYIDKQYLAVAVARGVITYGIFNTNAEARSFSFTFIPYIFSGLIGFLSMTEFFITKTAGYVRLIEHRIAKLMQTEPFDAGRQPEKHQGRLPPLLWESYYADKGIEREKGPLTRVFLGGAVSGHLC